ncbi:MAG: MFS transporter [Candidatus Methanofastidiosia archaeon]
MHPIQEEIHDYIDRLRSFSKNSTVFLLSYSLVTISRGIFTVIFNLYILELGFSTTFLGVLISSHLIGTALFLFPGGAISDKIGRKKTLVTAVSIMVGSIFILSTFQDKSVLLLANGVRGVSFSLLRVTVGPFMMEQSKKYERMHLFSVNASIRSFSSMFGNIIGGFLPGIFAVLLVNSLAVQYQYTLVSAGVFTLIAIFPLLFIKEKRIAVKPAVKSKPLFSGKRPFVAKFALCSIIIGFGAGVIVPYFNVYFSQSLGATSGQIGLIFSAGAFSMGIASLILPLLVRKFGRVNSTVITHFLSIPFLLLIMVATSIYSAFIGYFLRTTLMNVSHPAQRNFYMDHIAEHERAKANSISRFGSTLFRALGSDVGGFLISEGSFSDAFKITAVIYVVGTILFFVFFRTQDQYHHPEPP